MTVPECENVARFYGRKTRLAVSLLESIKDATIVFTSTRRDEDKILFLLVVEILGCCIEVEIIFFKVARNGSIGWIKRRRLPRS